MTSNSVRAVYPRPQHHVAHHRGGSAAEFVATWRSATKKARQEICAPLKWFCFTLNVFIFLAGVTCLALGIYLYTKEPRPIAEPVDVALNPAVLITLFGGYVVTLSLCGMFGALRDNVFLLKTFALCVFCGYVALVVATFGVFMLFYSEASGGIGADIHGDGGISATTILNYSIRKYHTNRNVADFVDYIQEQLECCGGGSSAQGFRDWGQLNVQFQCNQSNPYPERCGVPFTCCRKSIVSEQTAGGGGAGENGAGGGAASNALLLPAMRSLQCWQNAQQRRDAAELESDIYTRGCAQPLRAAFDKYALHLGAVVLAIIIPVCFGVCLSQCLARQIDYQRYLLAREARRHERQMRRERRYLEQQQNQQQKAREKDNNKVISTIAVNNNSNSSNKASLMEQGQMVPGGGKTIAAPLPPVFAPPPAPNADADAVRRRREQQRLEKQQQQRCAKPAPTSAKIVYEGHRKTSSTGKHVDGPLKAPNGRQTVNNNNCRKSSSSAEAPPPLPAVDPMTPTSVVVPSAPPLSSAYGSTYGVHYGDRQPQPYFLKQSDFS